MGRRSTRNYSDHMQRLVSEYRDAGEPWPATARDIARWMIRNRKWDKGERTMVELCARDVSRAMREEYHTDPQGRRVRTKHAAKFPAPGTEDGQMTLWHDIRNAPREFMDRAFKGRRNQIVGDCVQLNTDVKSYNENVTPDNPIPMLWDFTDDVLESEQPTDFQSQAVCGEQPNDHAPNPFAVPDDEDELDSPTGPSPAVLPPPFGQSPPAA